MRRLILSLSAAKLRSLCLNPRYRAVSIHLYYIYIHHYTSYIIILYHAACARQPVLGVHFSQALSTSRGTPSSLSAAAIVEVLETHLELIPQLEGRSKARVTHPILKHSVSFTAFKGTEKGLLTEGPLKSPENLAVLSRVFRANHSRTYSVRPKVKCGVLPGCHKQTGRVDMVEAKRNCPFHKPRKSAKQSEIGKLTT